MKFWPALSLDDVGRIVTEFQHRFLLLRGVKRLHHAANGGDKGVVAGPEVPVRHCWLASSSADFVLELVEQIVRACDQRCHDSYADGAECGGRKGEAEE